MQIKAYREILIFVAGTTPQIITETLYGLIFGREPPILPHEIHVITTQSGKAAIKRELLQRGRLEAFFREFDLEPIPQEKVHIIVVRGSSGEALDDIREARHNEAIGDLIADFIREKAMDPASRLHCSLAGGRKTMSFYLGSALQLFGRPWDRLYHVLVTPEFESHPDFYYKPRQDSILEVKDAQGNKIRELNTGDASITLAELPFLRLRDKLSLESKPFRDLVAESQRDLDAAIVQPALEVILQDRRVRIGSRTIDMAPMHLMLYCAFLREKLERCRCPNRPLCLECAECFLSILDLASRQALEAMARDYKRIYGQRSGRVEKLLSYWENGFDKEALRQTVSKINRALKDGLDDQTLIPYYSVTAVGKHGSKRHGVMVERGRVRIIKTREK